MTDADPYCRFDRERYSELVRVTAVKRCRWLQARIVMGGGVKALETIRNVMLEVWSHHQWADIVSKQRDFDVIPARQAFIYLAKMHAKCQYSSIGRFLGKRHHTTIAHGYREAKACMDGGGREWKADAIRSIVSAVEARLK